MIKLSTYQAPTTLKEGRKDYSGLKNLEVRLMLHHMSSGS